MLPQMKFHVVGLGSSKGGKWIWNEARPHAYLPPPAPPAKPM
jgi:hypothetical protein